MPLSDYQSGIGGGLKLKGVKDGRVKKHKSKSRKTPAADDEKEGEQQDKSAERSDAGNKADGDGEKDDRSDRVVKDKLVSSGDGNKYGKTEAQLRYEERRRQMTEERIKKEGVKTHKERVEELNKYLSRLSEHHDMPKIGPG